jgi:uridylate kinase
MKQCILIKLSGELFAPINKPSLDDIIKQIKQLHQDHQLGIVIGGGNICRASKQGKELGLAQTTGDGMGMLATVINGLMLQDLFNQAGINTALLSGFAVPSVTQPVQTSTINAARDAHQCIIFVGGTGNPFFTTDTCAVLRALQMNATEVWKATKVDGVYDQDPMINKQSSLIKNISYQTVLEKRLGIIDATAVALAQQYGMPIRVFNMFSAQAFINAAKKSDNGSIIQ